jgi:adenylate kinase family enzyme
MDRILVLGSSGSGKTTLADRMGKTLDIDVIHLDSHYWQADWTETPSEPWERKLEELLRRDRWVMDGNYVSSLDLRIERADTVVFIDLNRAVCLWRCVRRYIKHRGGNRPELAPGCNEKIDWAFFKWIWNYPRDVKPRIEALLADQSGTKNVVCLKSERKVAAYLKELETIK